MLKLEKTSFTVDIYGVVVTLSRPTVAQQNTYANSLKGKDDSGQTESLLDLMAECGLPRETAEEMEGDHLLQVVNALIPSKKK